MKTIVIPNQIEMMWECLLKVDGILLGINHLSVNLPFYIELEDLKEFTKIKQQGKLLFIMLNKNMHNHDLESLKKTLVELEKYPIDGVFFYDISIVNLAQKLNLSYPLIWSQEHLTTNPATCNFWQKNGVSGAYLSNEITLEEIKNIRQGTSISLFVNLFGYLPMFHSKRHLVKNYLETFHISAIEESYFLEKEGKQYPIIDDELGTTVYSSSILNALPEYFEFQKIGIDYVILNSFQIEKNQFLNILMLLNQMTEENKQKIFEQVNQLCFNHTDKGFLYKETVYKVKGDS